MKDGMTVEETLENLKVEKLCMGFSPKQIRSLILHFVNDLERWIYHLDKENKELKK